MDESYFVNTDMQRDVEASQTQDSLSRSNPRRNDQYKNMILPDKISSPPTDPREVDDDEMADRIMLQGEKLIKQPEIVESQPHKQLERAMKDQKLNS